MPERSFGRTVRYRRTKLGLSQAKLGDLVGRSATTIRSWERDQSQPNDPVVLTALAAILGVDERALFEKVGQKPPQVETSPTIEQELATLAPEQEEKELDEPLASEPLPLEKPELLPSSSPVKAPETLTAPAYASPPQPYVISAALPPVHEPSYMEDSSQRQLYRVRNLATIVLLIALGIALIWALGEGLGAIGEWWDDFFGNLRL